MELSAKMIEVLKEIASREHTSDVEEFEIYDYCGGDIEEAWSVGQDDGEIYLARKVLRWLKIDWEDESEDD